MLRALRKTAPWWTLALGVGVTIGAFLIAAADDILAYDFHRELYLQAEDVVAGRNPYPPPDADLSDGSNPIWPVAAVALVAPLVVLPPDAADVVMSLLVLAALPATLLVLGVRDPTVLGVTLLWPSVISSVQTANLTLPLALAVALAWRYRDRSVVPGVAIGAAVAVKFFVWPVALWLLALRRYTAAALAACIGLLSLLLIAPFTAIGDYVRLLRNLSDTFDDKGYTLYALGLDLGASSAVARTVTLALGAAFLLAMWRRRSFVLALAAALVLSPLVWLHFFALLVVPLAIARPRFHWTWLLPLAMVLAPGTENGRPWQTALVLVVAAATLLACTRVEETPGARWSWRGGASSRVVEADAGGAYPKLDM